MALRGTLKDFGIADIFQLIGHQGKSGTLTVKNRDEQVHVTFFKGQVLRARPESRKQKDLLGAMLVRGEVVTAEELEQALQSQQSSSKRLGELLLEITGIEPETLNTFFRLQTTETLYRLFLWDSGNYEFKNDEVEGPADSGELIRSENVLMEGFRQVDEWPRIRRHIGGYGLTFSRLEDLDELAAQDTVTTPDEDDPFADLDAALGELDGGGGSPRLRHIRETERMVYALIAPDRDCQKIIDLSRLGEFETCKALCNLIEAKIIEPLEEAEHNTPSATATVGGITRRGTSPWMHQGLRAGAVVSVMAAGYIVAQQVGLDMTGLWGHAPQGHLQTYTQEVLARAQVQRLRDAIEVYRVAKGVPPPGLQELVESGLVTDDDLSFPWRERYHYAVEGDGYVLMRPYY